MNSNKVLKYTDLYIESFKSCGGDIRYYEVDVYGSSEKELKESCGEIIGVHNNMIVVKNNSTGRCVNDYLLYQLYHQKRIKSSNIKVIDIFGEVISSDDIYYIRTINHRHYFNPEYYNSLPKFEHEQIITELICIEGNKIITNCVDGTQRNNTIY